MQCIWWRTHLIPGLPVPHFLSPWTNNPHKIDPHGQLVSIKFGPHEQMVPQNLVPLDKWSPTNLVHVILDPHTCPSGQTEYSRDHLSRETKYRLGTICIWGLNFWDHLSMGPNWLGTVCPEGPIIWGPHCGVQMSGDHMRLGPNLSQPILLHC